MLCGVLCFWPRHSVAKNTHNFSACVGIGLGLTVMPHDDVCVNSCMSGLA